MGRVTDQASQPIAQTKANMQKVHGDRAAAAKVRGSSLKEQKTVAEQAQKSETKKATKSEEETKKLIVIDAGHGGSELGSNYGNLREKDLNLKVALKVKSILLSNDYEVIMIRTSDVTYHYNKRWQLANKKKADLFVSIHTNSIKPWAHGAFIMTPSNHDQSSSDNLANKIHMRMSQAGIVMNSIPVRQLDENERIAVLRGTEMPAVLVEMGYIVGDAEHLTKAKYLKNMAWSIAYGIMDYYATYKK